MRLIMTSIRKIQFNKLGGSLHLDLSKPENLRNIIALDEPYWMSTSAPVSGYGCDKRFLYFLDKDNNGRIRCREVREAVQWLDEILIDFSIIGDKSESIALNKFNIETKSGRLVFKAAERILTNLGDTSSDTISLTQVRDRTQILAAAGTNGDGIIPPEATSNLETKQFIKDILKLFGGEIDASGKKGITENQLKLFDEEAKEYLSWYHRGYSQNGDSIRTYLPWGNKTHKIVELVAHLKEKIDEFFLLNHSKDFLQSPKVFHDRQLEELFSADKCKSVQDKFAAMPLTANLDIKELKSDIVYNPFYNDKIREFLKLLKEASTESFSLNYKYWLTIISRVENYYSWQKAKPDTSIENLGVEKIHEYLTRSFPKSIQILIDKDKEINNEMQAIDEVEKVILFKQWLLQFTRNFVAFSDLYDVSVKALFEWGRLTLDSRTFTLCLPVQDRKKHVMIARQSGLFILYLRLTQNMSEKSHEIAVAVTSGNSGQICIGKKGVFYTYDGIEYDAEIVESVKNPISLREALFHPFKRLGEIIEHQIEKIIGRSEKGIESALSKQSSQLTGSIEKINKMPATTTITKSLPKNNVKEGNVSQNRSSFRDLIVSLSLSAAAVGTSFAFVTKTFSEVRFSHILITLLACLLIIIVPTIILTLLKLHRRDIGMFLEAAGWAINGRMRLTRKLCKALTTGTLKSNQK